MPVVTLAESKGPAYPILRHVPEAIAHINTSGLRAQCRHLALAGPRVGEGSTLTLHQCSVSHCPVQFSPSSGLQSKIQVLSVPKFILDVPRAFLKALIVDSQGLCVRFRRCERARDHQLPPSPMLGLFLVRYGISSIADLPSLFYDRRNQDDVLPPPYLHVCSLID